MANKPNVLVLDDDPDVLNEVAKHLRDRFEVECVQTLDEARSKLFEGEDTARFSVAVIDMRLKEGEEGGLVLLQELNERELRPETIILTAYPDIRNASKCMQAGAFGYVEKGREDAFDLLADACIKANERWHRRFRRIPDSILESNVALLFGDIVVPGEIENIEMMHNKLRKVADSEIKTYNGYLIKFTGDGFLAIFDAIARAIKASLAIQGVVARDFSPVQLRESVHWGKVERIRLQDRDDITGTSVLECVRLAETAEPGQVVLSQEARDVLGYSEEVKLRDLGKHSLKGIRGSTQLYEVVMEQVHEAAPEQVDLPEWVKFALDTAKKIEKMGIELPSDLAIHHDHYAHGKPKR